MEDNKEDIKREVIIELLADDAGFWWLEATIESFHPGWDQETVHAQAAALVKEWVAEGVMDAGELDPDAERFKPWNLGPDETHRRILDELEKLESDIVHPGDVCYLLETDRTFDYIIQNYPEDWERFLLGEMKFIGDRDLQKRVWLPEDGELIFPPKSTFEVLLHEYKFEDYLSRDGFHLSEEQKTLGDELYGLIKDFYDQRHGDVTDPDEILSDPEWDVVTKKANKFVSLFLSDQRTGRHIDGQKNQDVVEDIKRVVEDNKEDIKREVIIELLADDMSFSFLESIIQGWHPDWDEEAVDSIIYWDQETVHAQAAALVKEWVAEGVMGAGKWDRDARRFKSWNLGPDETRRRILDELEKLGSDIVHPGDVCYLLETDCTFDYIIQNYPEDWERFLLGQIQFIGDRDLQKRVWLPEDVEPLSPKCSFEDLLHKYKFEDYLSRDGFHLSEEQKTLGGELYGLIKDFYDRRHGDVMDPDKILSDPEWDIITKKANKFVSLFPSGRVGIYQTDPED